MQETQITSPRQHSYGFRLFQSCVIQVQPLHTEQQFTVFNFSSKLKCKNQYLATQLVSSLCCGKTLQVCKVYGLVCIQSFLRIRQLAMV